MTYSTHLFNEGSVSNDLAQKLREMDAAIVPRHAILTQAQGFVSQPYPLAQATATGNAASQSLYGALQGFKAGDVITNVAVFVTTAGTVSAAYGAIYDASGAQKGVSADFHASWGTGLKQIPLTAPYTVPADAALYCAFDLTWSVQPVLASASAQTSPQVGSNPRAWALVAAQATPGASVTWANSGIAFWVAAT